ncbi:MAG: tetratricopeptide repeat protein [Chloroflexota bacterium]
MTGNVQKYLEVIKIGEQFNAQKKWHDAIGAFRMALGEIKNRPEAYVGLAEACIGRKQYDRALDCYKLAFRTSKNQNVEYLEKIADLQERMGRLGDAARTYMALGETFFKKQEIDGAISNWQRANRLDPDLLGAHKRLALAFQRQNNKRAAVREYLAIARILDAQGKKEDALKVCAAAAQLEPDNPDIDAAIELIEKGADAFDLPEEDEEEEVAAPEAARADDDQNSVFSAVRQMASILEASGPETSSQTGDLSKTPSEKGIEIAREDIAAELFSEEDEDSFSVEGMLKLERDALLGQALHYQDRGQPELAITNYEKAIDGGLNLPAAWFMLGILYMQNDQEMGAIQAFDKAGADGRYAQAIRDALS